MDNKKLSNKTMLAYGVGGLGEGIGYNFFYAFFMFFLTTVAGVNPGVAGIITLIAVLWDGVSDPLIGYLSDNSRSPRGRRRPFILVGCILFGLSVLLLFTDVPLGIGIKPVYFIAINMLYWTGLTLSVVPHTSLGSELTADYDDRTKLRSYQTFFMNIGAALALSLVLVLVSSFTGAMGSEKIGWSMTGLIFGLLIFLGYFISYLYTKGKEPKNINLGKKETGEKRQNIFKAYRNIFSNKPLRYIIALNVLVNFMLGLAVSVRVFLYTFTFGFDEVKTSSMLLVFTIGIVAFVPVVNYVSAKIGKKKVTVLGTALYALGFLLIYVLPASDIVIGAGLLLESFGNATFWTMLYALAYDTAVVEEYKTGTGNEGIIVATIGFTMKAGNALGMGASGLGLTLIGFNQELMTQSAQTTSGLHLLYSVVPFVLLVLGAIIFAKYPLTRERYDEMREIVRKKKQGEQYDTEGLESLVNAG
ncbi:MFS transporter [Desulfotignum balticum]|uniref:MFS transporter n=1 Tax=Desulfotignum balticum TaxID=115781 RepID=UPI00042099A4|nr:glycoside-pentoside-hexuronide (GPH):cation symporter [Desulfotignum balticum]